MTALTIDGSQHSGSGTIVRYGVALAALLGRPLRIINARAKRPKPGLRPQHLTAVQACAALCGGTVEGLRVGSQEIHFAPGGRIRGGEYAWDIGTAGSTTMLALSILPIACFADGPVSVRITGGVFQDFAPSPFHMKHVLLPHLARMGVRAAIEVERAGYVPAGAGVLRVRVTPPPDGLASFASTEQGTFRRARAIAFASHLAQRDVTARMGHACVERLRASGLRCDVEEFDDTSAARPGACLAAWTESDAGCVLGADRAGAPRRSAESIGAFVAAALLEDIASGATVDRHVADQLILFAALARGTTTYVIPERTDHVDSNLWLATLFGARATCDGQHVTVEGLALTREAIAQPAQR